MRSQKRQIKTRTSANRCDPTRPSSSQAIQPGGCWNKPHLRMALQHGRALTGNHVAAPIRGPSHEISTVFSLGVAVGKCSGAALGATQPWHAE